MSEGQSVDNSAASWVAPLRYSHPPSEGHPPGELLAHRWQPGSPYSHTSSSFSPPTNRRSPRPLLPHHEGWREEGEGPEATADPLDPFNLLHPSQWRLPALTLSFQSLFFSQPAIAHFSPTHVKTAPTHALTPFPAPPHSSAAHFVRLTSTALQAVGQGDMATFISFISDHNVLVIFSSLSPIPGLSRMATPFIGITGQIEAFTLILSVVTYHHFNATVVPVAHSMEGQVKVMITGDCTAHLNRNHRVCSWSWVRFFIWDEKTEAIVRMEYYEMDQAVAEAYEEGQALQEISPAPEVEPLTFPSHADIPNYPPPVDGGHVPSDLPPVIPLDANATSQWTESWSDPVASQYPGLPPPPEDGGHQASSASSHSSSPSSSSPSPDGLLSSSSSSSFSPPTLTPLSASLIAPPSTQPALDAYVGWGQPGMVDQGSSSVSTCKLYTLIPDCMRDVAVSHSKWGYRGARSICAPCQVVCTFPSDPSSPTIFKPFTVHPSRIIFVCMRLQGEAAVQRQEREEAPAGARIKRRLKESSAVAGEGEEELPEREYGVGRMTKGRRKIERDIQREFKIDRQGRLMNRNRSVLIEGVGGGEGVLVTAKRLTVQVSGVEELYLYIFHSAEEAAAARMHWRVLAMKLRHVRLTCHRLHEELSLKYQHTGEEIKVAADQLHQLLIGDPNFVTLD